MKRHKHKGFTLVEVLTGFVMLSFIVVMVSTVMGTGFMLSARLHELPNTYYGAQDEAERKMDEISSLVKEKFRLENVVTNTPLTQLDPNILVAYTEVCDKLDVYPLETWTLFGKSVDIYKLDVNYASADNNQYVTLYTGVVNAEKLERKVPIVDKVTIKAKTGAATHDLYFAEGVEIESSVDYNNTNYEQKYKDLYQWYIGTGGFHTAEYSNGTLQETEISFGKLYTQYPSYYTLLPGETKATITIKEEYYGQLLVCVVTPLSKNGAMGNSVASNPLYISALPKLSSGTYRMIIDVSAQPLAYTTDETVLIDSLPSRGGLSTKLTASGTYRPLVNMNGAQTDTHLASAPAREGTWSRFVSFTGSTYMTSSSGWSNAQAFVVARKTNAGTADMNFIGSGSNMIAGFSTNIRKTDGSGDTRWQLLQVNLPSSSFNVGKAQVEVAELIVVTGASNAEKDAIWAYLLNKYRIIDNNQN